MSKAEERRRLKCPQAHRDSEGRVRCDVTQDTLCANQRYCGMIGLWIENDFAKDCPLRNGKPVTEKAPRKRVKTKPEG